MPSTSSSPCLSIPPSPSVLYASQPASCLFQGIARRPLPWHARARHRQPRRLPRGRLGARRHGLDAPQPLRELGSLPRPTRIASIALSLPGELPISSPSLRCLRCRRWTPGMRAQSSLPSSPAYRRSPLLALVAIRPSPHPQLPRILPFVPNQPLASLSSSTVAQTRSAAVISSPPPDATNTIGSPSDACMQSSQMHGCRPAGPA
jgi:hypothetical protein